MIENIGLIYKDNLESEHVELRSWFQECFAADRVVPYGGQMWTIDKIETNLDLKPSGPALHKFVVTGRLAAA